MKKTLLLIVVIISLLLFICFTIWYYKPISSNTTIIVYNKQGESTDVILNFMLQRSYFTPTVIRGEITMNSVTYVSFGPESFKSLGFWKKLNYKLQGIYSYPFFGNQDNFGTSDNDKILEDNINIISISFDNQFAVESIQFNQTIGDGINWSSDKTVQIL